MSKIIEGAGFTRAKVGVIQPRLILSIQGPGKTGKTNFSLTSDREPILYVNLNKGDEGVIGKFVAGGVEIWRMDLPRGRFLIEERLVAGSKGAMEAAAKEAKEAWDKFSKGIRKVRDTGGTIILDTASELWELLRLARLGKLDQVKPHHYGPVNAEYEAVWQMALDTPNLSLIAIHELRDEYVNEKFTGKRKISGYKRTEYLAQVMVEMYKTGVGEDRVWGCRIIECRHNPEMEWEELEDSLCNFPTLRDMVLDL